MHFKGALKQSPLEPGDMFYQKQKFTGLSLKPFTFILPFLLRNFLKSVGEILRLLTLSPQFGGFRRIDFIKNNILQKSSLAY